MDKKAEKKKKKSKAVRPRARSELGVATIRALVTPVKMAAEKRKKAARVARTATASGAAKPFRDPPPVGAATASEPKPKRRPSNPQAKKPKRRPKAKPESAAPEDTAPQPDVFKLSPNIQNGSKYIKPSYDAWVSTTPAAIMRQCTLPAMKTEEASAGREVRSPAKALAGKVKVARKAER